MENRRTAPSLQLAQVAAQLRASYKKQLCGLQSLRRGHGLSAF
jgi:hypothetical protein